jgi:hypothetical protein
MFNFFRVNCDETSNAEKILKCTTFKKEKVTSSKQTEKQKP